jgi:hypothetical protein
MRSLQIRQRQSDCHPDKGHRHAQSGFFRISAHREAQFRIRSDETDAAGNSAVLAWKDAVHATRRKPSSCRNQPAVWFQLANVRVTTAMHRRQSGQQPLQQNDFTVDFCDGGIEKPAVPGPGHTAGDKHRAVAEVGDRTHRPT